MSSRLRAASLFLVIAVAGVSVLPKIDLPETAFDESGTPTIQTILTTNAIPFRQCNPARAASAVFTRIPQARVRSISPAYTTQSSEFRHFQGLNTLRC
jgi:hypothetical protein